MWLALLVFLILGVRLYFAYETQHFATSESYLHIRSIESLSTGKLLVNDPLGYGGRLLIESPLFNMIITFFTLFLPFNFALKFIPNLFASILIIPIYLISYRLTQQKIISFFTALLASIIPAYLAHTYNHVIPLTIAIPLFFTIIYLWMRALDNTLTYLFVLLLLAFLHLLSLVFVLSIGIYIIIALIEKIQVTLAERELAIFTFFFMIWAQFIIYKKLILFHGPSVVWQNLPDQILTTYYSGITLFGAILHIGIYPLFEGTYALYRTAFKKPDKDTHILLSLTLASAILLVFKLIDPITGFILLGITLAILFAKSVVLLDNYFKKTKLKKYTIAIASISIFLAILTTAYPAYTAIQSETANTITNEEISALKELQETNATIASPADYGHYITAITHQKNVIDSYYFLRPKINERYDDISRLYKTTFETEAVEIADKYNITYIVVPPKISDLRYGDKECFKRIHATNIKIYKKNDECHLVIV